MGLDKATLQSFGGFFPLNGTEYFDPPEPLLEGIVTKGQFTMLTGQPKCGKSTLSAHIAYSIATGEPLFERKVEKQGHVVYLAFERENQTQERINKLFVLGERQPSGITLVKPQWVTGQNVFFFDNPDHDDAKVLVDAIEQRNLIPTLIVVDSLENSMYGSDNDSKDAGAWCNGLTRVIEHFDASGLVIHHETKASNNNPSNKQAYSGSRVFLARAGDWVRALSRENGVLLKNQDGNYASKFEHTVRFNDFGLFVDAMPMAAANKKPTQIEFITARLAENPQVTQAELVAICVAHPENTWPGLSQPSISRAIDSLGSRVHTIISEDGRKYLSLDS